MFKVLFNHDRVHFDGNCLFTGPEEILHADYQMPEDQLYDVTNNNGLTGASPLNRSYRRIRGGGGYGAISENETMGTTSTDERELTAADYRGSTPHVVNSMYSGTKESIVELLDDSEIETES